MAVSIRDIADAVGLSPSAVSIALNNKPGIGDEARQIILSAAADMGYSKKIKNPDYKNTDNSFISLFIYKKHGYVVSDTPFFSVLLESINASARKSGYTLQTEYIYDDSNLENRLKKLHNSSCIGIILLATEMEFADLAPFSSSSIPLVILDSYFEGADYNYVVINNIQGAYLATQFLIDNGHTDIGYLHSSVHINNFSERYSGYLKAVGTIPTAEACRENIIRVAPTYEGAYNDMALYIKQGKYIPKALFADNDIIAISCMRALEDYGYKLPEDVSIVAFDNFPSSELLRPSLTTIDVSKSSMGSLAVDHLLNIVRKGFSGNVKISLSTTLVIRNSVCKHTI